MKDFKINSFIDTTICQSALGIIKNNWDSFCEQGTFRPMFAFEFFLDIGISPPTYCRQPVYGIHERKIMNTHVKVLEHNDLICDCVGPWGLFYY